MPKCHKLSKKITTLLTGITLVTTPVITSTTAHADTSLRNLNSDMTYLKSSERKPYPDMNKLKDPNILVNIKKNRVFLRDGNKTVYTMYCSAGQIDKKTGKSDTPTGHFKIQNEHGNSFYNAKLKEGANDWTSFKDHGVYLFHTVPTDEHGNYKPDKAKLLGKRPDSHGCIRLSVPDAKYINQKVPAETPVTIVEK